MSDLYGSSLPNPPIGIQTYKDLSVFFRDRVALDAITRAVQSLPGFEIESEAVLAAANHLVPNVASFQRRTLVRAPSLNGVENAGAAQNQDVFSVGQPGRKVTFLVKFGELSDKNIFHESFSKD